MGLYLEYLCLGFFFLSYEEEIRFFVSFVFSLVSHTSDTLDFFGALAISCNAGKERDNSSENIILFSLGWTLDRINAIRCTTLSWS